MTETSRAPGVAVRTIDLTGPTSIQPIGIPAGVIGTSKMGPAFVPVTTATVQDFAVWFGAPTDDAYNGPLAISEWLRNRQSATFLRVLGVGEGRTRETSGNNRGRVAGAGFVVGDRQPQKASAGALANNAYANVGGFEGRLTFLGVFMSESNGSTYLTAAGLPGAGVPLVRAVLMTPSGVLVTLSASHPAVTSNTPTVATVGSPAGAVGAMTGSLKISGGLQEFVMLLNGHKGPDLVYPRILTASLDVDAPNYFGKVFNKDPLKLEKAGHLLYSEYQVPAALAVPTGSSILLTSLGGTGLERIVFVVTGSQTRNSGSTIAPNFEGFEDRYRTAKTPWITSQKFGGSPQNLFRVWSLDDGAIGQKRVKFSIENLFPSSNGNNPYGTFDLLVRSFYDNDKAKVVYEAFRGLSLNPSSPRYIAKVIGDYRTYFEFDASIGAQKIVTLGDYQNLSNYIRVEMADKVTNAELDASALPMGFRGHAHLVTSGSAPLQNLTDVLAFTKANVFYDTVQVPVSFRENLTRGTSPSVVADKGLYWGVQFERKTSVSEKNKSLVPEETVMGIANYFPNFHVDYQNVVVMDNEGTADTTTMGILDADRFGKNAFSLENIRVKYISGSSTVLDSTLITSWSYVRGGGLSDDTANYTRALSVTDLTDPTARQLAKFSLFLQGGFDGVRIFDEDTKNLTNISIVEEMNNTNRGTSNGPTNVAYNKALDIIGDSTEVDIQLLAIPGIRHSIVTDRALQVVENRFDALFLMDLDQYDTTNLLITASSQQTSVRYTVNNFRNRGLNSSFGAAYFPDVNMNDGFNAVIRRVPPSVVVLGAFGKNDAVAYPWFAPAGFTRGALETTQQAVDELNETNLGDLYDERINPLVAFPGSEGTVVWGQKTLLNADSALERVNVRRLLVTLRREVKRISNRVLFEQGKEETLRRFSDQVKPIFKKVQDQRGLDRFVIRIDTSTTTQADFENKTIRGKIYVQPTRTLEFLSIDFSLENVGAT
jgi:hypothetical protein